MAKVRSANSTEENTTVKELIENAEEILNSIDETVDDEEEECEVVEEVIEPEVVINKETKVNKETEVKQEDTIVNTEKEAKGFLSGLLGYLTGGCFNRKLTENAQKSGLDKRKIANSFATNILGKISDVLHTTIDIVGDAFLTLISLLAGLLTKTGDLLIRITKRIVRIFTFNYTSK